MSTATIQTSFTTGEVSPVLFGHVDLARYHTGASTVRNAFVNYRGGLFSRAGTGFVNYSKQTGRGYPPRLVPFQFSIDQGLALEFGHHYMRVIYRGGLVIDDQLAITGATQANPCVISLSATGGLSATPITAGVTSSYVTGELVTLAGGVYTSPAILQVLTTTLLSANVIPGFPGGRFEPV